VVQETVLAYEWALQLHGFYANTKNKSLRFDVVMSFDIKPREGIEILTRDMKRLFPDYTVQITPDVDVSDL
ncbi:MAG: cation transporter, partial [Spirochaetia bacterium]|nr:cation transporter [Spirochaetia bacterium]